MTMQKAVVLAHLRVAYEPDDYDDDEVVSAPARVGISSEAAAGAFGVVGDALR